MNMTLKEMLLQVNDRLAYLEEKIEYNNVAMANLMESVTVLAESLKDFFGSDLPEPPPIGIKIPFATSGNVFEKLNDPTQLIVLANEKLTGGYLSQSGAVEATKKKIASLNMQLEDQTKLMSAAQKKANEFADALTAISTAGKDGGGNGEDDENPLLGGVTPDLTNQQLALYQQFLDQRAELFGMDTERQLEMLDEQTNLLTDIYVQQGMDVNQVIDFYAKARQSILLADTTETLKLYSQMATGFSSFLGEFAGMAKVAARIQQASALIDAYATANALMADPKLLAAFPLNIVAATAALASGLANVMQISKSIGEFKSAATGFDGVGDRPTLFMTGEGNKKERVSVTPLESANVNGPQGGANITINVSAPLMDETVIDTIIPAIKRAERLDLA